MHDVIIDDTQNSFIATSKMDQRKEKLKKDTKPKRMERLSQYLIDWWEKALILGSLLSLNFLIFAGAGSYNMFSTYTLFTPEVWYILVGIFALSIVIIYCFSFFKFLQNLIISCVVYYFIIAMLNQFASFDKNTMLASLTATYISQDLGLLLTYVSHIVVALVIAGLVFIFLTMASKISVFWFLSFLIICNFMVIFTQLVDNKEGQKFNTTYEEVLNAKAQPGKRFIYIGLQGLGSYALLDDWAQNLPKGSPELADIQKTQNIMLGFYAQNGFIFYPQSYVNYESGYKNFAQILNANSHKNENDYILKNVYPDSFWRFNHLNNKDTYLKESSIYKTFQKSKFNIHAYQSSGIELCKINNEMAVQHCTERNGLPISFDDMKISVVEKIEILLAQWMESTGIFSDFSGAYTALRSFSDADSLPMIGISYKNIGIKNSADVLDIVAKNLDKNKGDVAYFINIDLPHDTFIYDEYCQIKPIDTWVNKTDLPWNKNKTSNEKRKAFVTQVRCVYGKLQEFLDQINQKTSQKDTVIFIQGLSGLDGLDTPKKERTFIDDFKNKNFVDSAVKDPLKKGFQIKTESCSTPDILTQYLYRKSQCNELEDLKVDDNLKESFLEKTRNYTISSEKIEKAEKEYTSWYKNWQKVQNKEKVKNAQNIIKKEEKKSDPVQNAEIKKAPEVMKTLQEEPENKTEKLTDVMKTDQQITTDKDADKDENKDQKIDTPKEQGPISQPEKEKSK